MDLWSKGTLKPLLVPGGVLFLAAVVLLRSGLVPVSAQVANFYYFAVFLCGILLAWRFHSSRTLSALLILLLAARALQFFSAGHAISAVPARTALEAIALLLPLNIALLPLLRERGLAVPAIAARLAGLFLEAVFVAVLCRPGTTRVPGFLHPALFDHRLTQWSAIPQLAGAVFVVVWAALLFRFLLYRKPFESGLFWSLAATFLALQAGGVGRMATAYFATSGLILAASIIENSYVLAFHDELTGLPARRAFNDAVLLLKESYTIAVVDIDHFKNFNDTYGHETGDQVLRMVAARLARVTGGGQAYRVGGEEFTILFPAGVLKDVLPHLDLLRMEIESSTFRTRGTERRSAPHPRADRRKSSRRKGYGKDKDSRAPRKPARSFSGELSVTVSIGAAERTSRQREAEEVIQTADRALYRAKQQGRNRVETATPIRPKLKRSIA